MGKNDAKFEESKSDSEGEIFSWEQDTFNEVAVIVPEPEVVLCTQIYKKLRKIQQEFTVLYPEYKDFLKMKRTDKIVATLCAINTLIPNKKDPKKKNKSLLEINTTLMPHITELGSYVFYPKKEWTCLREKLLGIIEGMATAVKCLEKQQAHFKQKEAQLNRHILNITAKIDDMSLNMTKMQANVTRLEEEYQSRTHDLVTANDPFSILELLEQEPKEEEIKGSPQIQTTAPESKPPINSHTFNMFPNRDNFRKILTQNKFTIINELLRLGQCHTQNLSDISETTLEEQQIALSLVYDLLANFDGDIATILQNNRLSFPKQDFPLCDYIDEQILLYSQPDKKVEEEKQLDQKFIENNKKIKNKEHSLRWRLLSGFLTLINPNKPGFIPYSQEFLTRITEKRDEESSQQYQPYVSRFRR